MKLVSKMALSAVLAAGAAAMVATPADAQRRKKEEAAAPSGPQLSKEVRPLLADAQKAIAASNWTEADAKLTAAQPLAQTPDDKFFIAQFQYQVGTGLNDQAKQAAATDAMAASGGAPADLLPKLVQNQAAMAVQRNDMVAAETHYARLAELTPDNGDNLISLAEIQYRNKKVPAALATAERAIAARKASGQAVPEDWYRRPRAMAYEAKMVPEALKWSESYTAAYPTADNWRTMVIIARDGSKLPADANVDLMRLLRTAGALKGQGDYLEYVDMVYGRFPGEAKAVLDEGSKAGVLSLGRAGPAQDFNGIVTPKVAGDKASLAAEATKAKTGAGTYRQAFNTADAYLGYNEYDKAIELYRVALTKTGADAEAVNTRLGVALARAGRKQEALDAFAQVKGPRQVVAQYWTMWLNRPAAAAATPA